MGNKKSVSNDETSEQLVLLMYQQLINKDLDEELSMIAARKHPNNLQKAVNFILDTSDKQTSSNLTTTTDNERSVKPFLRFENVNILPCKCKCITSCPSLKRIIELLLFYKSCSDNVEIIDHLFEENKHIILNDYHHIINMHLNEDSIDSSTSNKTFEEIYNILMNQDNNLKCDINKCEMYRRNNRQRNCDKSNDKWPMEIIHVSMDFIDCIHCYFMHSVDTEYRMMDGNESDNIATIHLDVDTNSYFDKEIKELRHTLSLKQTKGMELRGFDRIKNNKFVTQVENKQEQQNNDIDDMKHYEPTKYKDTNKLYSFGFRFSYEPKQDDKNYDFNKLSPKYMDLKEELLSNKICKLRVETFNHAHDKSLILMNTSNDVKRICAWSAQESGYVVNDGSLLTINHILSIILYCDYDNLSYNFSSTFRFIEDDNSKKENVLSRNLEYGNWTKYLTQTVNCFGNSHLGSKFNVLFHGISFLYVDRFICTLNGPTSTTTKLAIAFQFAQPHDGIIMEWGKAAPICPIDLRYFNCSLFSYFGNEDERLFINPPRAQPIQTIAIRNICGNEYYQNDIIKCLAKVQSAFGDAYRLFSEDGNEDERTATINDLFKDYLIGNTDCKYPEYIKMSFRKWINRVTKIRTGLASIDEYIASCIIDNSQLNLYLLNKIFINLEEIMILEIKCTLSFEDLFSALKNININIKESKLRILVLQTAYGWERRTGLCSIASFNKHLSRFKQCNWEIKDHRRCERFNCIDVIVINKIKK